MELEELKNVWASVDERLKKQEILNKRMIQEALCDKSNKSLNKLVNIELINIVVLLLTIPIWFFLYNWPFYAKFFSTKILAVFAIAVSVIYIIWSSYKLKYYVLKIDFSKSIKNNTYYVNKCNIFFKREKIASYFIVTPVISFLAIWCYYELKAPVHLWIFLFVSLIIATFMSYWMNKKIYDKNIQSIKKSLDELKELEEESEEKNAHLD